MSDLILTDKDRKLIEEFLPILEEELREEYNDRNIEVTDYEELGEVNVALGCPILADISVYIYGDGMEYPMRDYTIEYIKERVKNNG